LPNDVTIPIKLADGFVLKYRRHTRDHAGLAAGHIGELDHDVSAGTADQRRVEHATREAPMTPMKELVKVAQVGATLLLQSERSLGGRNLWAPAFYVAVLG
jgi:hypothetical protein